jgi:hypothetical protein
MVGLLSRNRKHPRGRRAVSLRVPIVSASLSALAIEEQSAQRQDSEDLEIKVII